MGRNHPQGAVTTTKVRFDQSIASSQFSSFIVVAYPFGFRGRPPRPPSVTHDAEVEDALDAATARTLCVRVELLDELPPAKRGAAYGARLGYAAAARHVLPRRPQDARRAHAAVGPERAVFRGDQGFRYPVAGRSLVVRAAVCIAAAERHAQNLAGRIDDYAAAGIFPGAVVAPACREPRHGEKDRRAQYCGGQRAADAAADFAAADHRRAIPRQARL